MSAAGGADRLEIEVKFWVDNLAPLRARLMAAGATLKRERTFEYNIRYDLPNGSLAKRKRLLRLRRDQQSRLTYKGPAPKSVTANSQARVREEIEVAVSDFETMQLMAERLGFVPQFIYEKYRASYLFNGCEVVLDELPYGNFVEIEGSEAALRVSAERLNLDWSARLLDSYLALFDALKKQAKLPFRDLTFDNFADIDADVSLLFG